ncbi:MAG: isoprenyl transferase [Kiritimatiellae bacterium]|nr:isoprenyl transferase [Kiritimatiellia bacterium]
MDVRHIAIIMDGNGRWAQAKGLPRVKGHEAGAQNVRRIMKAAKQAGVKFLTLYAFSVENWNRPKLEVEALMRLLKHFLSEYENEFHESKIRLRIMGRKSDLPEKILKEVERVEEATAAYSDYTLIIALSYGGRVELVNAAKKLAERVESGELKSSEIDESTFVSELYLPDVPDPDLIIRTSGEFRVSNFLLWQCAYSEFYITPICWPDFDENELEKALESFASRDRRFGGLKNIRGSVTSDKK